MVNDRSLAAVRIKLVAGMLLLGLFLVALRAAQLQIVNYEQLSKLAAGEYLRDIRLPAKRGNIFDRNGKPLAISVDVPSVFANPQEVNDPRGAARTLAKLLDVPLTKVYSRLAADKRFVWLRRHIDPALAKQVREANIAGIGIAKEPKRFYPNRHSAASLVGFCDVDGRGLEGIELAHDVALKGVPQVVPTLRDARGANLLSSDVVADGVSGADIFLTIDTQIQHAAESALEAALQRTQAKSAVAVVLDVAHAEILAAATLPDFNANEPSARNSHARRHRPLTDMFEPGSTFKPLTVAAALDAGVIKADERFDLEGGRLTLSRRTIRDSHPHENLNVTGIIQKSSNIGAAKIGIRLGKSGLHDYLEKFGFGAKTGVQFPGESAGRLRPYKTWSDVGLATISYGHGVAVNALQLAAAYRVLASGGEYLQPTLVQRKIFSHGEEHDFRPAPRRVISRAAAAAVVPMLEAAVGRGGTGWRARIPGYRVAGKTGTAQKVDAVTGGYSNDRYRAVFAGFVPADNPVVVIVVAVDEPIGEHQGGQVAAPIFAEIAQASMRQLGIIPAASVVTTALQRSRRGRDGHRQNLASGMPNDSQGDQDDTAEISDEPVDKNLSQLLLGHTIPSFLGLTASQVMLLYKRSELQSALQVFGSGLVVSQTPRAGTAAEEITKIELQLAMR